MTCFKLTMAPRRLTSVLLGLALTSAAAAQSKTPPTDQLERFGRLDPAARLKLVEALKGQQFAPVERGDLVETIIERGSVEAVEVSDLVCRVRARDKQFAAIIKWVIDDGTKVKKGERVLELDDSTVREQLAKLKVKMEQANARTRQAEENLAASQAEMQVDVRLGEIAVRLAELDLKKQPTPAAAQKEILELRLEKAKLDLKRLTAQGRARTAQGEAEVAAMRTALKVEAERVKELEQELAHCIITAPRDGVVVYYMPEQNRFGGAQGLVAQGEPVREGQKLLRVVELTRFAVQTKIHEAFISKIRRGQKAKVRVDAFPKEVFDGQVNDIAIAASQTDWLKSDVKVYAVQVALAGDGLRLKPGMSAEIQIATALRSKVLQAPLTAILGAGKERFCFVRVDDELQRRDVVAGASNDRFIEIREGLCEGEQVLGDPRNAARQLAPKLGK